MGVLLARLDVAFHDDESDSTVAHAVLDGAYWNRRVRGEILDTISDGPGKIHSWGHAVGEDSHLACLTAAGAADSKGFRAEQVIHCQASFFAMGRIPGSSYRMCHTYVCACYGARKIRAADFSPATFQLAAHAHDYRQAPLTLLLSR